MDQTKIGLAFTWAVIAPGIPVLADVVGGVATNALLYDLGVPLSANGHSACLATIIYGLGWRDDVVQCLERAGNNDFKGHSL